MIKIKTITNPKLLKNFINEEYPDICIVTTTSRYHLTLAYLAIDSEYFNQLDRYTEEVDLKYLPEKQLVRVLKALYGDQLVAYSIAELDELYRVIEELRIDDYKKALMSQIQNNRDLMQNLQILQFCIKNNLMADQIKRIHIQNNLKALEQNRNFLQLNKVSVQTLISLLLQYQKVCNQRVGQSIINNIMQNYFNRNNIKPVDFFQQQKDVDVLLQIWQKFHHMLPSEKKVPLLKNQGVIRNMERQRGEGIFKNTDGAGIFGNRSLMEIAKLKEKDERIKELISQQDENKLLIEKLNKQLQVLQIKSGKSYKRTPSTSIPVLENDNEISILQYQDTNASNNVKKYICNTAKLDMGFENSPKKMESKSYQLYNPCIFSRTKTN